MESGDCEPRINVTINKDDIVNGAIQLVKMIRTNWPEERLQHKIFNDGISNHLVGIWYPEHYDDMVLVRIYGHNTEEMIDRKNEIRNVKVLHEAGYTHSLYATFNNGFAYEFLSGDTLNVETIRQPKIYQLIARRLAQMHLLDPRIPDEEKKPMIWEKTEKFMRLMPTGFSDEAKQKRFVEMIKPRSVLEKEYRFLKSELSKLDSPSVYSHNDLLLTNILYDCEKSAVTFIDFEYTAFNYQAYDIANHFAEFAGIENPDYSLYPDESLQKSWLREYLKTFLDKSDVSDKEIVSLCSQVDRFILVAHFFWGCWALIQSHRSQIDFDFLQYSATRFDEYFRRKSNL